MKTDKSELLSDKNFITKSIIRHLREKYPGKWIYHGNGNWEHINKGWARNVAILGGFNGDDYCGSELIYYPENGKPERVF